MNFPLGKKKNLLYYARIKEFIHKPATFFVLFKAFNLIIELDE